MDVQHKRVPLETWPPSSDDVPQASPPQAEPAPAASSAPLDAEQIRSLEEQVIATLCTCFDPEIPVNIHELGLIYGIDIQPTGSVHVRMTLTSPACPVAGTLPPEVQAKVQAVPGVTAAKVEVVWDPPWSPARMSEAAKLQLGLDDW
jgi:FeS assembly SUF system protein